MVDFMAQGVLTKGKDKTTFQDITNSPNTVWTTTNNPAGVGSPVLQPPPAGHGGEYQALNPGCACIDASSGGINGEPVGVAVEMSTALCSPCPLFPTPTPTGAAVATPSSGGSSGAANGTLLWTFDAQAPVAGPIVPDPSGGVNFVTTTATLHSLDSKGKERFDRPAGGLAPAVAPDGTIFVRGTTSWLYALDLAGNPKWQVDLGSGNGPLAADADAVYASVGDNLVALKDGQTLWSVPAESASRGAIVPDGVVIASEGHKLMAFSHHGSSLWTFAPTGGFSGELTTADGVVYAGSAEGGVYALDASNGNVLWQAPAETVVTSGPTIGNGAIYFGARTLHAVDQGSGTTQWSLASLLPLAHGLAALTTGTVFDAAEENYNANASMLTSSGDIQWTARDLGKVIQVAPGPNGIVYEASSDGHVRALK